jgi:hypothetical protein
MDSRIVFVLAFVALLILCEAAIVIAQGRTKKPCTPGTRGCKALIIPYRADAGGRPIISLTVDDKKVNALLDTGAMETLLDSKLTGLQGKEEYVRDFHGSVVRADAANMKVCIENLCDYEDVNMVPNLVDGAVLRGAFLSRFSSAKYDYQTYTITLEGWR